MDNFRIVFIGNFALPEQGQVFSLKSYAKFFNDLVQDGKNIEVFGGYIRPGETGFEFSHEDRLSDKISFTLSKGNTPTTGLLAFIWNNIILFFKLTRFSLKKGNYFVFLPSPIGVWSILVTILLRKKITLGIYIGGYYQKEQAIEQRKGFIKKKIKKMAARIVERLVSYSIQKADYTITPSYELYHSLKATKKVFLTPPMINVEEKDLDSTFYKDSDKYVTFCGELRHAKGIVDLLKAFAKLIKEERIKGYKLKIIGNGQAFDELKHLAKENGIEELVVFDGQIKDKAKLKNAIGNSTIFVLPSYSEGFPRVAYESFTLGVPTILTPVGGIPFFVRDNVHCLFSQPGNVNNLANKIETLINDETLQKNLSDNARKLMVESVFPRIKSEVSLAKMVVEKIRKVNLK